MKGGKPALPGHAKPQNRLSPPNPHHKIDQEMFLAHHEASTTTRDQIMGSFLITWILMDIITVQGQKHTLKDSCC